MKYLSATATLAFFILFVMPLSASSQKKDRPAPGTENVDLIENAIIVDNLSLVSEKTDTPDDSDIIYDDSFDNEFDTTDIRPKKSKGPGSDKPEGKNEILTQLRAKDSRWHYTQYEIDKGDTLWGIARKFRTSHKLIIRANSISGPDSLKPGRTILVPNRNGIRYSVDRGDTLTAISRRFGVKIENITAMNRGTGKVLRFKDTIFIPDATDKQRLVRRKSEPDETGAISTEKNTVANRGQDKKAEYRSFVAKRDTRFIWPIRGKITSGFGSRNDPFSGKRSFHNGLDISAESGTPVKACADGTVIFSGWKDGYGNLVVLKHKNGYISVYGHNSVLKVEEGETVKQGDIISLSGMTGAVTGAHLHFELQRYQIPLNPRRLLK